MAYNISMTRMDVPENMKIHVSLGFLALVLAAASGTGSADEMLTPCHTVDECINSIRQADPEADFDGQLTDAQQRTNEHMVALEGAVPRLVALLAHPDDDLANIAAAALREAPRIDPEFLPQIIAGLDRNLGWLPAALGRIKTEAAAREAVARYIGSSSAPHNQEAYALQLLGPLVIAPVVEAARCSPSCMPDVHHDLARFMAGAESWRGGAGEGLMVIVEDPGTPRPVASGVLEMIGALGEDGRFLDARLEAVRTARPDLGDRVEEAIVGVGGAATGAIYGRLLSHAPSEWLLRDLADAGRIGREAGPAVVSLLDSDNPDVRVAAARALGYIGFPAVSELVPLLDRLVDVRLSWAAAESLGRIGDRDALPALDETARNHWYPAVRDAASLAIRHIGSGEPYPAAESNWFFSEFFAYMQFDLAACTPAGDIPDIEEPGKLHANNDDDLARFTYVDEIIGYGAADADEQRAAGAEIIEVNAGNLMEVREPVEQVPTVALQVDDGWLLGSDRGEWGGELVHFSDDGSTSELMSAVVEDIFRLGDRIIATTGLAHLGSNSGLLVDLSKSDDGTWRATPWRQLPGAPRRSWLVSEHELLVETLGGGTIVVSADGTLRMADCHGAD